ncbi:MAG TPA: 6-phosphofructokinase [Chroococcales cyanobacterium]
MAKGNCLVAQSGGPTAVINASACGVIQEALRSQEIGEVYAANHGVEGILNEELFSLRDEDPEEIELMRRTPASALGTCRYKVKKEEDFERILRVFEAHDIRYFFYIGGNDSMDTTNKVGKYARDHGYELKVIGVPKTIDNDLPETDHCPGFGSVAKYLATSIREAFLDLTAYNYPMVKLVEVMGRGAGWIAASSALAAGEGFETPDLIYLPEIPFSLEQLIHDAKAVMARKQQALIVISEGIKTADGKFVIESHLSAGPTDAFGHVQLGGVGDFLTGVLREEVCKKVRFNNFGSFQRCALHFASKTDSDEAYLAGQMAVRYALEGNTGKMVAFDCTRNPYKCSIKLVELDKVANLEKLIPRSWINAAGNHVNEECLDYLRPLVEGEVIPMVVNGIPRFTRFKKNLIPKKLDRTLIKG